MRALVKSSVTVLDVTDATETNQLPTVYPSAEDFRKVGSELLAIELSQELKEYVFWFKSEQIQEVI